MYVNFGKPISMKQHLGNKLQRFDHAQLPAHVQQLTKEELSLVNQIGHTVMRHLSDDNSFLMLNNIHFPGHLRTTKIDRSFNF